MKKGIVLKKFLIAVILIIAIYLIYCIIAVIYWINTAKVEVEKNYNIIVIESGEIADYKVFLKPAGKYEALKQIEESVRLKIVVYMKDNDFILCEGEHKFNRTNAMSST